MRRRIAGALAAGALLAGPPLAAAGGDLPEMPPFELENWDGRKVSLDSLRGATTLVAFTYAKCVFACPMLTFQLQRLDESLGGPPGVRYLHVSVNPEADSAEEILLHFEKHDIDPVADPRWLFLNRPVADVHRLVERAGIEVRHTRVPEGTLIDHTIQVWVLGPDGRTLAAFATYNWDQEAMHHALRQSFHGP